MFWIRKSKWRKYITNKQRLKGYGCGYHKQLEKQMLNRIKQLKKKENG